MAYFTKLFSSTLILCCSLFYFMSTAHAHNCTGRIVNDSSGPATVYITPLDGGGNLTVLSTSSPSVSCSPSSTASGTITCTIPNNNAGLTFVFTHTDDNMKALVQIEVNGKKSSKTEFGGSIDFPPLNPVCNAGDLLLSNSICVSGVCAQSMGLTANIQIYDEK